MIDAESFLASNPPRRRVEEQADGDGLQEAGPGDPERAEKEGPHGRRPRRSGGRRGRIPRPGGFGLASSSGEGQRRDDADDPVACREAALTLLDAAARSSGALAERLRRKGFQSQVVDDVIDRLLQVGLLDDRSYAEDLLRSCLGRDMGERGALNEMTRKGLPRSLAQEVVAQAAGEGLFVDSAYELGRKVAAKTRGLDMQVRRRRLWGAGGRKGHDPGLLSQVAADVFGSGDPLD